MTKATSKSKKKGGEITKGNGSNPPVKAGGSGLPVKLGRPPKENREDVVRNNGFTIAQWTWLEREAALKEMDVMSYIRRYPIQWWIESVEASRAGSVATLEDDQEYEKLVVGKKK